MDEMRSKTLPVLSDPLQCCPNYWVLLWAGRSSNARETAVTTDVVKNYFGGNFTSV